MIAELIVGCFRGSDDAQLQDRGGTNPNTKQAVAGEFHCALPTRQKAFPGLTKCHWG